MLAPQISLSHSHCTFSFIFVFYSMRMSTIADRLAYYRNVLPAEVTLVAVSKFQPIEALQQAYACGQRDFGENRVQEMCDKQALLPSDVKWHQIGHLQRNKVKYIAPFVHLIHSVDSEALLAEIDRQAEKVGRIIPCLLQVHIAKEDSKFGLYPNELLDLCNDRKLRHFPNVRIQGLMGMATLTDNLNTIKGEFEQLKRLFEQIQHFQLEQASMETLSMGMSDDYKMAIQCGSNMVRIGSKIFGSRG